MICFVACAENVGVDDDTSGSGGDASTDGSAGTGNKDGGVAGNDGGWPTGSFGSPCSKNSDCGTGFCADIGKSKPKQVCVNACSEGKACPSGGYCTFHPNHGYICVPDSGNQCEKCTVDAECPILGDRCTPSPKIDRFCARDCSFDSKCPSGFDCVAVGSYPPGLPPPVSDGGAPDAALGEAGAPTKPLKMCVPTGGDSCPCNSKRDGVKRRCTQTNGSVTCEGTETCNGQSQKWEGCTAGSPQPEVCDGADNDCNGTPDDGTPDKLCPGTPPHAKLKCSFGACVIDTCDTGWAAYPPGPTAQGCPCQVDSTDPANDTCSATAPSAGSVTDANTTPLTLKGTLSSDADVDWWRFNTVDSDETTTNSYHIKIEFSAPAANSEFVFDVIRGGTCGTPDTKHSNLTSYDWCVDGTGTVGGKTVGEKSCGATASIHCGPHTKAYLVRVKRKTGATPTCSQYTLTVTAKGGGTCDFTQACDPQINEPP